MMIPALDKNEVKQAVTTHFIHLARYFNDLKAVGELTPEEICAGFTISPKSEVVKDAAGSFEALIKIAADIFIERVTLSDK